MASGERARVQVQPNEIARLNHTQNDLISEFKLRGLTCEVVLRSVTQEEDIDTEDDCDRRMTPFFKTFCKERMDPDHLEENDDGSGPTRRNMISNSCICKSRCRNRRCSCKEHGSYCSSRCHWTKHKCANREKDSCMSTKNILDEEIKEEILP